MIKALILYAQFFTRLPIPVEINNPGDQFKNNMQFFSIFGVLLGLLEGALFFVWAQIFPLWFAWVLFWIGDGLITGGFHLDALADTADALFSSRKVEKMRAIMKDSRLGTMGSLALVYFYLIVIGAGIAIINRQPNVLAITKLAIICVMITKSGISLLFFHMHYAGKSGGLASIWEGIKTWRLLVNQVIALLLIGWLLGLSGIVSYAAVIIVSVGYRHFFYKLFGGLTGDTVGCYAELSQAIFLLVYAGLQLKCQGLFG